MHLPFNARSVLESETLCRHMHWQSTTVNVPYMTTSRFLFLTGTGKSQWGLNQFLFVVTSLVMTSSVVLIEEQAREPAGLAANLRKKGRKESHGVP
jgi:hypothetical protein